LIQHKNLSIIIFEQFFHNITDKFVKQTLTLYVLDSIYFLDKIFNVFSIISFYSFS